MGINYNRLMLFIAKVRSADVVKVFSFTAISTLVKMLTGLVSVKVVAVIIGPSGIALLGQLNNFSAIIMTVACGGINNGVTKYVSEHNNSDQTIRKYLSTALRIVVICSSVCGLLMILLNQWFSKIILLSDDYGYLFIIFGLTLFLYALNMLLSSVLNGYKEFKKFVSVNIVGSLLGLIFTLSFVYSLGLKGALISTVTFQSIMFFVTLWMVRKLPWVNKSYFKEKFDFIIAQKYFKYTLMTLVTAATVPVSQLLLRGYVISNISVNEAGWWEAMNRISNMYLMIITSSFGVYYLPKLSEIKDDTQLRQEIYRSYKVIIPLITIGFLIIYVTRILIIKLLFTASFLPMANLFAWQLIGDFFKISSWLLAFIMVAKTMTKIYITTEILFSTLLVGLGYFFVHLNGIVGLTQAYMINYFLYLIYMVIVFRKLIFRI
jgi:PST family polysaccharide transporter